MKNALILHGLADMEEYYEMDFPSPSNAHWLPWLQQKFLREDIVCQTPELGCGFKSTYKDWSSIFPQFKINENTSIVAHSMGCGFILKYLSQNKNIKIDKLILVAPWRDLKQEHGDFLQCTLATDLKNRTSEIHVLYSTDEEVHGIKEVSENLRALYPSLTYHEFKNKGHFCLGDLGTEEFLELWNICHG